MPMSRRRGAQLLSFAALSALAPGAAFAARRKARPASTPAPTGLPYGASAPVMAFADEVAQRRGLPAAWLHRQLAQARRVEAVRRLIMPPPAGTAKNWAAYRARFIEAQRIGAGVAFWNDQERWLRAADERWGVAPEYVVGIVGVETMYGRMTGSFRVLDALATLTFDFPPGRKDRSAFFRDELEQLFVLCRGPLPRSGAAALEAASAASER